MTKILDCSENRKAFPIIYTIPGYCIAEFSGKKTDGLVELSSVSSSVAPLWVVEASVVRIRFEFEDRKTEEIIFLFL